MSKIILINVIFFVNLAISTIDINEEELIYLSNHLTIEECRKLVAYAHYKTYDLPNALDQAEHKISSDERCIDLLKHWNSAKGEGKGESHEVLVHRLLQMNKQELAEWLGKTVFKQLGEDLDKGLKEGLKKVVQNLTTTEDVLLGLTFAPPLNTGEPTAWLPIDTVMYVVMVILLILVIIFSCKFCLAGSKKSKKSKFTRKLSGNYCEYERVDGEDTEDEEEKFVVRRFSSHLNDKIIEQKFQVITY